MLQNGRKVAIKLMDQAGKQGEEEFKVEVGFLCFMELNDVILYGFFFV